MIYILQTVKSKLCWWLGLVKRLFESEFQRTCRVSSPLVRLQAILLIQNDLNCILYQQTVKLILSGYLSKHPLNNPLNHLVNNAELWQFNIFNSASLTHCDCGHFLCLNSCFFWDVILVLYVDCEMAVESAMQIVLRSLFRPARI